MAALICVLVVALALLWSGFVRRGVRSAVLLSVIVAAAAFFVFAVPSPASAQVSIGISIGSAPPPFPEYSQPYATQPNMIWQPGYWGYGRYGFFWVPGTWVEAPQVGLLWTPGYWGWNNGGYSWYPGYWGQNVGYYGGINYGYGYYGSGYRGGRWNGNSFQYNRSVTNVGGSISSRNSYSDPGSYVNQNKLSRTSYNGGAHGVTARPSQAQIATEHQRTYPMTSAQTAHVAAAQSNRSYLDSVNHGKPAQASVSKPLSASNRPAGFAAVKTTDRPAVAAAAKPVQHAAAARPVQHTAAAPQKRAAPAAKPQQQHAAPAKPHGSPKPLDLVFWSHP